LGLSLRNFVKTAQNLPVSLNEMSATLKTPIDDIGAECAFRANGRFDFATLLEENWRRTGRTAKAVMSPPKDYCGFTVRCKMNLKNGSIRIELAIYIPASSTNL